MVATFSSAEVAPIHLIKDKVIISSLTFSCPFIWVETSRLNLFAFAITCDFRKLVFFLVLTFVSGHFCVFHIDALMRRYNSLIYNVKAR